MKVDGGVSKSNFMLQYQADICNCNVIRLKEKEITAMGVALFAGLFVNFYKEEEIDQLRKIERIFTPQITEKERNKIIATWKKAIETARHFVH